MSARNRGYWIGEISMMPPETRSSRAVDLLMQIDAQRAELLDALRAVVREANEGRIVSQSGDYIESRRPAAVMDNARATLAKATRTP